jgi:hypothetical protein
MFSDFNENWYQGLFWSEELIGNDGNCIHGHFYDATVSNMAANKIDKLLMVSDFNENWYLGVFWSEELVGNNEICIQGHFYEATIFKMAANKIVKLSMVSDFIVNWYLGVFWSEELVGSDETCIRMPEFWYGGRLGTSVFASKQNQTSLLLLFFLFFFSPWTCSTKFSETDDPIFAKLHRKVDPISRGAIRSWNFQNGRRWHGNREHMSKYLTSIISETAKRISTKLGISIKHGW